MKLLIQNAIASHVAELRACDEGGIDAVVEKMATSVSVSLSALRQREPSGELVPAVLDTNPAAESVMLCAALAALSEGTSLMTAHQLFVDRLSEGMEALKGGKKS